MHASSLENMQKCYERYLAGSFIAAKQVITVLDVGGNDINGSYRQIFSHPKFQYITADLSSSESVNIFLNDAYRLPLADHSIDIVISGQAFEHVEFFWLSFQEMVRVLHPDGFIFLIAPSAGPIHRYPVDCYRFYPDAYQALAKYTNCYLEAVWQDERGPWKDLVGVFRKYFPIKAATETAAAENSVIQSLIKPVPTNITPGAPEVEVTKGEQSYLKILECLHQVLKPALYLEIGVRRGISFRLAQAKAIGIDPNFEISDELPSRFQLFQMTSDRFFESHGGTALTQKIDLAFIDGMHWFEFALRDFMNVERYAHPAALIVIDDIFPNHPLQTSRERQTQVWTGDVWKLYACLQKYRPDLKLIPIDAAPAGLLIVAGLDPNNRVLWDQYNSIIRDFSAAEYAEPPITALERQAAISANTSAIWEVAQRLAESDKQPETVKDILSQIFSPNAQSAIPRQEKPGDNSGKPIVSLIVISYNMHREIPRTIRSLSPLMQHGVQVGDYEIILIDNGSSHAIDRQSWQEWNAPLRYFEISNPTTSPVPAINWGLELARGELCGVMIDGARIASPGLLARVIQAARLHHRPVISTLGFHLGSEVQMISVAKGYDQVEEDRLLEAANWTEDGYRLFDISVFAGSSAGGWFAPIAESNALFLPRKLWQELGGYDEQFVTPGGGLANLDMYDRACTLPDSQLILLLGEGTFHQVHGGIATNALQPRWQEFHDEYLKIRGRPFQAPQVTPLYLGQIAPQTLPSIAQSVQIALQRATQ